MKKPWKVFLSETTARCPECGTSISGSWQVKVSTRCRHATLIAGGGPVSYNGSGPELVVIQ